MNLFIFQDTKIINLLFHVTYFTTIDIKLFIMNLNNAAFYGVVGFISGIWNFNFRQTKARKLAEIMMEEEQEIMNHGYNK